MVRKWSSVRERGRQADKSVGDVAAAFQHIANTEAGDVIKDWLASIVCDVSPCETESAWRQQQARRSFAEEILQKMDGGTNDDRKPGDRGSGDDH